jgi:hypothetical protein
LVVTEIELKAITADAIIELSKKPQKGYNTPAITGIRAAIVEEGPG